jgi:lysophospholipid acyltransferase (LPLAT)-like uncharacterized protein
MSRRWISPRDWPISLAVAPWVASLLMRAQVASIRRIDIGRGQFDACMVKGERVIVAFWHGRLLMMPFGYPGQRATILISRQRDGEYITRIAERLGFRVVRGSATQNGASAFRQLLESLQTGDHVVVTPDGPKGPARRVKSGVIELSRLSGMPILPVGFGAWPRRFLKSWDRFLIPYPFAHGVYVWGEPMHVPTDLSKSEAEKYQSLLAERLDAVTAEADSRAILQGRGA